MKGSRGKVFLVGAGPGDPKLLTLRGKEVLERADVVLYDYLANPSLLEYTPPQCENIYVGRRGRGGYRNQEEINRLMVERAQAGKNVVRLKGGDPFVFGRGGEEAEVIALAGLAFEVVPGVSSATAVPAYAGIPVTHRTLASTVAFVTGHEDPGKGTGQVEWPKLATAEGTLVFLMGMKNLPHIVENLLKEGKAIETPVALIRWGTKVEQQTVVGTLGTIVEKAEREELEPPTLIVIGEVVRLRDRLNWFEALPLFGKRILVTRAKGQAEELSNLLAEQGGEALECPMIQIVPLHDLKVLDEVIGEIDRFQWIIFTSVNGVAPFMERVWSLGKDARALAGTRFCCIGPRTAEALWQYGIKNDLLPSSYQAEGVLEALEALGVQGQRILIPRAAVAREILPDRLRELGAEVQVVPVYDTVRPFVDRDRLKRRLRRGDIHYITFTSSSTVRNFHELFDNQEEMKTLTANSLIACIGPVTAGTAAEAGLQVTITPSDNTIPSLVKALTDYSVRERNGEART